MAAVNVTADPLVVNLSLLGYHCAGFLDYSAEVLPSTVCALIERTDGVVVRVTSHVKDLLIAGDLFSASPGVSSTAHAASEGLAVDNRDLLGLFENDIIDPADMRAGLYRGAEVWLFEVDYTKPNCGLQEIDHGHFGRVRLERGVWNIEFQSITVLLDSPVGHRYERRCHKRLGHHSTNLREHCPVDLAAFTVVSSVTAASGRRGFVDTARTEADNWFRFGELEWLTGANKGIRRVVKTSANTGAFMLLSQCPFDIVAGDQYRVHAGCNHLLKMDGDVWGQPYTGDCRAKFGVAKWFGGEPEMLGEDAVLSGPEN